MIWDDLINQLTPKLWYTSNKQEYDVLLCCSQVRLGVSAVNIHGTSTISYTWPPFNLYIPAPGNLQVTAVHDTHVDIKWRATQCEEYSVSIRYP